MRFMKRTALLLVLISLTACSYMAIRQGDTEFVCFTWGQATCEICGRVDETGRLVEAVDKEFCPLKSESRGLSDNGVKAIVTTITELPVKIIQAFMSYF